MNDKNIPTQAQDDQTIKDTPIEERILDKIDVMIEAYEEDLAAGVENDDDFECDYIRALLHLRTLIEAKEV